MSELTESLRHMADDSMGMEPGDRQVFSEAAGHIEELDRLNAQLLIAANHYEDKSKELEAQLKAVRNENERMTNLLEDVVNELDLSESAIEQHGPMGTAPAELVRLVLAEKDLKIAALKAGLIPLAQEAGE
jgi:hypothetical protein